MLFLIGTLAVISVAGIVALTISHRRFKQAEAARRRQLTPEQREDEDFLNWADYSAW